MPVKWRGKQGIGLLMLFTVTICLQTAGQTKNTSRTPNDQGTEGWVRQNYETIFHHLLPERIELAPFPRDVKWVAVVSIRGAYGESEWWLSLRSRYEGGVDAIVRIPRGSSLTQQIRELKNKYPEASPDAISEKVHIDEFKITAKQMPELNQLTESLERVRMSPVMPDTLMMDAYGYRIWSKSQYGQEISVHLAGPGPSAHKQGPPLLKWAENARRVVEKHLRRGAK